jgi:hypothetical protein
LKPWLRPSGEYSISSVVEADCFRVGPYFPNKGKGGVPLGPVILCQEEMGSYKDCRW